MGDTRGDLREDIPLKPATKSTSLCVCMDDFFGGSKLISVSFAVLSAIITLALLLQIYYGDYQVIPHGSVATDSRECSEIGTEILKIGGNAIDAAISSAICLAVVNPHLTGLDAEGQLMLYNHRTRELPLVIEFKKYQNKINESLPRLVAGLAYVYRHYSKLDWKILIQPSIDLARKGFLVQKGLASTIRNANADHLYGKLEPGQRIKMGQLANTLQNIANISEEDLYNIISTDTPLIDTALKSTVNSNYIFVPNIHSIGPFLLNNLQRLMKYNFTHEDAFKPEYYYRLAKITKETYDEINITSKYHEGTSSNVAVIDADDNYVALVTGMYQPFGSQELLDGYVLDVKNKSQNLSSRLPIIITNTLFICGRRMVLGTSNIITATQVISSLLIASQNITTSIESPRYNMFEDGTVGFEDDHSPMFSDEIIEYLESLGHPVHIKEPYASCNIVEKFGDDLNSHSDSRGGGISSRF